MCDKCIALAPTATTGSRRRRLWDLPHQCHCPVVGVCLPLNTLRVLVNKALGDKAVADDYEVHVGAVAECTKRNRLSELLHGELEKRYARKVHEYRAAKTTKAVADMWAMAVRQGDVTGAFWAALTHPRCDDILQEVLCRDMHMLQHQAGAAVRVDIATANALRSENGVLARELGRVQERCTRVITEKTSEIERLMAEAAQLRIESVGKDCQISFLRDDFETLKASIPGFETAARLQRKIEQMATRQAELALQNAELRQRLSTALMSQDAMATEVANTAKTEAVERRTAHTAPVPVYLKHQTVLCVGGRSGNIANYRDVIERVGGRFAHHDGGLEDNTNMLDTNLAAADLVICQTGCISHNAYWKVKDFCKRTGKRCVFVENPSASSLVRSLEQISVDASASPTAKPEYSGPEHNDLELVRK